MQRPLFLTGMMGCGKTTVGQVLAARLGVPQVDLDHRIERIFGATIADLFAHGEPHFRELERQALLSLLAEPGFAARRIIVTTGGGAILDAANREAMDRIGVRVYLEVGVDELQRRLHPTAGGQDTQRPLLVGDDGSLRAKLGTLLAARASLYRSAAVKVDADADPHCVAERIVIATGGDPEARDSEAV